MKFVVSSTDLLSHLQTIGRVISSKNTVPVLDSILFSLNENQLTIGEPSREVSFDAELSSAIDIICEVLVESKEIDDSDYSRPIYRHRTKAEMINDLDCLFYVLINSNRYDFKYLSQIPNGSLLQRRNRRARYRTGLERLREGGEIRQRYDVHSDLYRDRHRRLAKEISIGQRTARNISLAGESQRALSLLSNLNPEA